MKNKLLIFLPVIIIVLLVGFYIVKAQAMSSSPVLADQNSSVSQPFDQTASPAQTETAGLTAEQSITVDGNEFAFSPAAITVKIGQPVRITFNNTGKFSHNLAIKDLNVMTKTIQPGESDTVTFTPDKAGQFTYNCTVDSHTEKGMTGVLTVE